MGLIYDVRGRNIENAIHWSDNEGFAERARFNGKTTPAQLHLEGVQLTDEGVYRCRVDFKNTPTKNYQVNLSVIVPPYAMSVYNKQGEVKDSVIGPLEEGIGLTLSCEVRGGKSYCNL
ncbi:uncharacterized protein LOC113470095 [Diaphorina citri]|uniref:Uncharacterized protein LOC113470095 n=1 Tax=Diaphorina citri TaxID=121845 RepID=A0A3Q0JBH6_DIACI|nr:uncharacterized protein LOC113470095 [Diaphorina citri]